MTWIREANTEPIPGYRLISPLGSGGFGEVWKCEAPGGWIKAIKFVYGNRNSVDNDSIRADQEYKALQRIKEVRHPFVCSVEQTLDVNGELIIVMEFADCTLHDKFTESQTAGMIGIPADDLMRYMRDAAEALDFMYEKHNLQHLDVKPRNLFLIGDHVKVADFGLVKAFDKSHSSGILGGVTPLYASPETFQGKISPQSDQYSLAIVYQELLTGQRPFVAKNIRQMAQMHTQAEPDLRSLPEVERPVLARGLAKDPAKRFSNCMDFIKALYKARSTARIVEVRALAGANGLSKKTKSLSDTMEDMFLQEAAGQEAAPAAKRKSASLAFAEPPEDDQEDLEVSDLGVTLAQPETGSLRPTLIIGLGTFGRKAIMELRCRFLDRFGDLNKLPLLHFLLLDTDPEAGQVACNGTPQVALGRNDFYALPLQPVVNYRRRSLDQLAEWLPRDKLYNMPRSLQTMGSRALGRLAFADNQQRLIARLRREIQEITHPDTIYKSVENTGLALINNTPRVYILAAAGGGCSGMVADLGYALRRLLVNLRHPDSKVVTHLMCGSPQDPATPKHELANVYATLTELNHFSDPSIPFAAEYGVEGQRIVDQGSPMHSVYLLPLAHRSPDALEQTVAHLGSYLFHELTTPLGLRLEVLRHEEEIGDSGPARGQMAIPLRSFGTYAVWFPRGLMLNLAARHACKRLIDQWVATDMLQDSKEFQAAIHATVRRFTAHPDLTGDALAKHIGASAQAGAAGEVAAATPGEVLSSMLAKLTDQVGESTAQDDPANWCRQAMSRMRDWMGAGADDQDYSEWRKTKLARALASVVQKSAEIWEQRITKDVYELMAFPGARVAGAEMALELLLSHFKKTAAAQNQVCQQLGTQTVEGWRQVEIAARECVTGSGGFRLFGGRSKTRLLRTFLDKLSHYAQLRLAEELNGAAKQGFSQLVAKLADRLRDLGFCRQRLRHLQESLDRPPQDQEEEMNGTVPIASDRTLGRSPPPSTESFWETIRQSDTARVVLPGGQDDLEQAALTFLLGLKSEQWLQLDRELHEKVLEPQGGLNGACMNGDLTRQMALPLLEGATQFLNHHLPIMDVAQIIKNEVEAGESAMADSSASSLREQTEDYLVRSVSPWQTKHGRGRHQFLLIPASNAGKALGEAVLDSFPELRLVRVPGQSDLMFLCEQGNLTYDDLTTLLKPCRAAYDGAAGAQVTSPHARFDVIDWLPLEP